MVVGGGPRPVLASAAELEAIAAIRQEMADQAARLAEVNRQLALKAKRGEVGMGALQQAECIVIKADGPRKCAAPPPNS